MPRLFRFLLLLAFAAAPAWAQRDLGRIEVPFSDKTIPVLVSGSPELVGLARQAFGAHGRYRLVASGYAYELRFTLVAPTQVEVDISRGGSAAPVYSAVVPGASMRDALLRAADAAVVQTNGLGLRGFFSSKLVFIGERTGHKEVYVSDLFLGGAREITHDRAIAMTPRWSPDGSKIIYTSFYHSGFPDIFLIDLNSYERTTFASFRGTNSGAHFSPDGRQVAMVLSGEGTPEIYVSNAQGRGVSRRTHYDANKSSPCWSPDGSRLVFASEPGPELYVMSAGGGPPHRITYDISGNCTEPDWSRANPDKIAFTMLAGGRFQIAVFDFSTGESAQVSHAAFDGVGPSWLPDGRHLVYTARNAYTSRLCILDTETGKSTPISPSTFGPAEEASVWAP